MVSRWWNSRTQGFFKDPQTHYDHPTLGPLISLISTFHKKKKKLFQKFIYFRSSWFSPILILIPNFFFPLAARTRNVCISAQCVQTGEERFFHTLEYKSFYLKDFTFFITAAYLLSAMDRTADPCHDFFQYACGSWNRKHVIPEDRSSISTFEVMADQLQVVLKGVYFYFS